MKKNGVEDLRKAEWFLTKLIQEGILIFFIENLFLYF